MKENQNIDELLNSFLDGELAESQRAEVERMISRDSAVAERLREIRACKTLVNSLPFVEAPEGMLDRVKSSLERKTLLDAQPKRAARRKGERHLFIRKMVSYAAMIGLVAILFAVIWTIVSPEKSVEKIVAQKEAVQKDSVAAAKEATVESAAAVTSSTEFKGRLVLETSNASELVELIGEAIQKNGLSKEESANEQENEYAVMGSRKGMSSFFCDLQAVWDEVGAAKLYVETDKANIVEVDKVNPEQIAEIINQNDLEMQGKAAKYFASLNNKSEIQGDKGALAVNEKANASDLTTIPKPDLTSGGKAVKKASDGAEDEGTAHLTIVIISSE